MKPHRKVLTALIAGAALSGFVCLAMNRIGHSRLGHSNDRVLSIDLNSQAFAQSFPKHHGADDAGGGVVVELCDGVTRMQVNGLHPGQKMTHEQALAVSRSLMAEWSRKHPEEHWEMAQGQAQGGGSEWSDEPNSVEATPVPQAAPTFPIPIVQPTAAPAAAATFPVPGLFESPAAPQSQPTTIIVETPQPTPHHTHHPHTPTPHPSAAPAGAPAARAATPTRKPKPAPTGLPSKAPTIAATHAPTAAPSAAISPAPA